MDHSVLSNRVKLSELCLPCEEERLYWGERYSRAFERTVFAIQNIQLWSGCKRYTYFLVGYTAVSDNFGVQ